MRVHHLLQRLRISEFSQVLQAYRAAGIRIGDAVDGGAGMGTTAAEIAASVDAAAIYAYEPFPGNHRFFDGKLPANIRLIKKALGKATGQMTLAVPSVVKAESKWGQLGRAGYSSAGHLTATEAAGEHDVQVDVVRADEDLPGGGKNVGFVKLDLQGGERDAINGMSGFLPDVKLMWVEFMYGPDHDPREIAVALAAHDFVLFDTQYLFRGAPTAATLEHFELASTGNLSSGTPIWYGTKREPWTDFFAQSKEYATSLRLVQTDLCCVNRAFMDDFLAALPHLVAYPQAVVAPE